MAEQRNDSKPKTDRQTREFIKAREEADAKARTHLLQMINEWFKARRYQTMSLIPYGPDQKIWPF